MKKSISWHKEGLENWKIHTEAKRKELERVQAEYNRMLAGVAAYAGQISRAEAMGKDGFDPDKFGKKRPTNLKQGE